MKTQDSHKIAFAGGGPFAIPIFKELAENYSNLSLITKRDKPSGRGGMVKMSPIKQVATEKHIPIYEPKNKLEMEQIIQELKPEVVVVASLGIIITQKTLDTPKYGFINVHFSLLPLHRGACPVQATILSGDKVAGITIQKMAAEIDAGDIIYKNKLPLDGKETTKTLGEDLSDLAARNIITVLGQYTSGKITPQIQDHQKATFTKMIEKSDGKIEWNQPAEIIERKVRAFQPWPTAFAMWNGKILKILEADVLNESTNEKPGTFLALGEKRYGIQTGKNILQIKKLQLEGKKPLKTSDFILGNKNIIGKILN